MLIKKSLQDYISQTASGSPTPGGGSVSALAASLGSALTNMVGNLTFGKKDYESLDQEVKEKMKRNFDKLEEKTKILQAIVDEDSKAFSQVIKAFQLPNHSEEEKRLRSQAIQAGYKKALEVPLKCAEECYQVLKLQEIFAQYGNTNAITDVGVGALLAYSGLEGSLLNVRINLSSIRDEKYKKDMEEKINILLQNGKRLKETISKQVYDKLK